MRKRALFAALGLALALTACAAEPAASSSAPESAPACMIWNIWSAPMPTLANCTLYSLMVSSSSPEKSRPFWAPAAIRFMASSPEMPKLFTRALAARTLSATSYRNTSRRAKAPSVTLCSSPSERPFICWETVATASATSAMLSP